MGGKHIYEIKLTLEIEQEGDYYVSTCLELAVASCGGTEDEALDNICEAILVRLGCINTLNIDNTDSYQASGYPLSELLRAVPLYSVLVDGRTDG